MTETPEKVQGGINNENDAAALSVIQHKWDGEGLYETVLPAGCR